ncbi:MAG: T9SS type A sorting domain-containing protein [Bacteroidales bacterium]|nr:T9SS type A sorting domain-containing protein [Bacteroidales bacterium]
MKRIGVTGILLLMTACLQAQTVVSVQYAGTNGVDDTVLVYEDTLDLTDKQFPADYIYISGYIYKGAYTMIPELRIVNNTGSVIPRGSYIGIKGRLNNIAMDYWAEEYWPVDSDWATGDTIICLLGAYSEPLIRVADLQSGINSICFMVSSLNYNISVSDAGSCANIAVQASSVYDQMPKEGMLVCPNPVKDILYICNADNAVMEIENIHGQKTISRRIVSNNCQVDVSNWPSGIYIVRTIGETGVHTYKINVMK